MLFDETQFFPIICWSVLYKDQICTLYESICMCVYIYIYIYTKFSRWHKMYGGSILCIKYTVGSFNIYICLWLSKLQLQPVSFLKHGFLLLSMGRHHHNGRWEARIGRVFGNKYLYLGTYGIPPPSIIVIWNQLCLTWLDSMVKNIQILIWLIKTILYTIKWYTLVFFRSSKILKIETQFYNSGKG